jgi:hypothetical protein
MGRFGLWTKEVRGFGARQVEGRLEVFVLDLLTVELSIKGDRVF